MILQNTVLAAAVVVATGAYAGAQQTVTKAGEMVKASATIQQIDATKRLITFRSEDGTEDTVYVGPEIKRFDELKVGDKVNMTYYESKVFKIRKPGDPPLNTKTETAVTGTSGALPGGTMAAQTVQTVTVKAVDQAAGTITVTTSDGRTIIRKVDDKNNLTGVNPGDQIDIITTQALLASVERGS